MALARTPCAVCAAPVTNLIRVLPAPPATALASYSPDQCRRRRSQRARRLWVSLPVTDLFVPTARAGVQCSGGHHRGEGPLDRQVHHRSAALLEEDCGEPLVSP
jgi:hypothetical protein